MKKWLKALLSETVFSIWWILSALSTLSTFLFPGLSGKPRVGFAFSTVLGFGWANYRVFQKQQVHIESLKQAAATQEIRRADLRIEPANGSEYILTPINDVRNADFRGMHVHLRLMIENRGRRNSIVNEYTLELLGRTYQNLRPQEGRHGVQGRHAQIGLDPASNLSRTGNIQIPAESATHEGTLLFSIPDVNMEMFIDAGLGMRGPERRFDPVRCRLTISDTTQSSASQEFELVER